MTESQASHAVPRLELARAGKVHLRQNSPFGTIYVRSAPSEPAGVAAGAAGCRRIRVPGSPAGLPADPATHQADHRGTEQPV